MMFAKPPLIGFDFAGKSLNLVQLQGRSGDRRLRAAASAFKRDVGEGITLADANRVMELLKVRSFAGSRVVSSVPLDLQLQGSFEIPPPESGAPIDEITRSELSRETKLPEAELESAWWVLPATGRPSDATRAITVGVSAAEARKLALTLEDRGFEPVALDVRGLAILRACRHLLDGAGRISTFVEIGELSTLTCVCLDDTIVYYRRVDEGLAAVIADVIQAFGVDAAVAEELLHACRDDHEQDRIQIRDLKNLVHARLGQIVQAVRAAIAYASHRYPRADIGNVLVLGTGADVLDVVPVFEELLGLSIRRVTLGDVIGDTSHPLHIKSALVPAAGLALYGEAA